MTGAADDGWEDGTWGVVSSKTGFAHTGAIVYNECGNIIIHYDLFELINFVKC